MNKLLLNTNKSKHIILLCFILFAFSPCIVKSGLFASFNTTYVKPSNLQKSTTTCSFIALKANKSQSIAKYQIKNNFQFVESKLNYEFVAFDIDLSSNQYFSFTGTSPPKYILFNCLKLDIV